jgi:alpha-methylacyl-CoA racemase
VSGPLEGVRIVELAGLGPAPFAGMMLADAGADIIRVDRADRATYPAVEGAHVDLMNRGRRSVAVDLKHPDGVALVLDLVEGADAFMEGFRPGVAERLGFGPDVCLERNPKLVYGRMTGWGQDGPMAQTAGHDIDYIALSGALGGSGPSRPSTSSATSAGAACCWPSAWWPPSWGRGPPAPGRWWTPPWWMVRRRS